MSIDYFNRGDESTKQDKSDWFASVTSILGCLNGNVTSGTFGCSLEKHRSLRWNEEGKRDIMGHFMPNFNKVAAVLLNSIAKDGTNDRQLENV